MKTILSELKTSLLLTLVLAFLIRDMGMRLFDAFFLLRSKRSIVTPNIGFMDKLLQLERTVIGTCSVSMPRYAQWYTSDSRPAIPDIEAADTVGN